MDREARPFDLVRLFASLADPTRLRLLNLMQGREVCVCYFVEILKQSQPKISRHLAYLRNAGIVSARRDGKWMHYSMDLPTDPRARAVLEATLRSLQTDAAMQADLATLCNVNAQKDRSGEEPTKDICQRTSPSVPSEISLPFSTHRL